MNEVTAYVKRFRDDEGIVPYRTIVIIVNASVGVDAHINPKYYPVYCVVRECKYVFGRSKPLPYGDIGAKYAKKIKKTIDNKAVLWYNKFAYEQALFF